MDVDDARWLVSEEAADHLRQAAGLADPTSLAAGEALRRVLAQGRAAALLDCVALRRRAAAKLGPVAAAVFLTHDGLEQATRWEVAQWRARGIAARGIHRVIDAGCGVGIDALACRQAGLAVVAIERDPVLAILAAANLALASGDGTPVEPTPAASVLTQSLDWDQLEPWLDDPETAIFLDPARRTARGRSWEVADMSPSWEFVQQVIERARGLAVVKLGPGFPHRLLPGKADVFWVSQRGDLVETSLWTWPNPALAFPGHQSPDHAKPDPLPQPPRPTGPDPERQPVRQAVLVSGGMSDCLDAGPAVPPPGPPGRYLFEPDPAVIRAGATGQLALLTHTHPLAEAIAYLSGDDWVPSPFASAFAIVDVMDYSEKALRAWAARADIGALEIKTRGLDLDPAALRRRLRLRGRASACVALTPSLNGAKALIVERIKPVN